MCSAWMASPFLSTRATPLSVLTKQQLADIFSGKITDWSQVGGPAGPIYLYAPDEKSGTLDTFKSLVLGPRPISARASRFEDSARLSDAVAADSNGIGFAGRAFTRNCKVLAISNGTEKPQLLTTFAISAGDYPLSRRLYLYVPADAQNKWTHKFIEFALPETGGLFLVDLRQRSGGARMPCLTAIRNNIPESVSSMRQLRAEAVRERGRSSKRGWPSIIRRTPGKVIPAGNCLANMLDPAIASR